jgi:hypothetical protein
MTAIVKHCEAPGCGKEIIERRKGRRRFCDVNCRALAYRRMRPSATPIACGDCGQVYSDHGEPPQYQCPPCQGIPEWRKQWGKEVDQTLKIIASFKTPKKWAHGF